MSISRRQAAAGLLAGFGMSGLARPDAVAQVLTEPDAHPDETVDTTRGRFEHIMAPVKINGAGPFKFLIDTGANISCVSQLLADRLALTPGPTAKVHTVVGVRDRPSVIIDHLEVGARTRRGVKAPSLNIATSIQADGVLGVDWLKGQRLVFDFKGQTLEIAKSKYERENEKRVIIPASRRWGQLTIIDADASGVKIRALIDSGSQLTICNMAMRDLIVADNRRKRMPEEHLLIDMETVAGETFSGRQLYLPFLRLGGLHLGNVPVVHADMHVFKLWSLTETPAIVLGLDLLTQFETVALDYGRSAVTFDIA
jgi:predicted aspartyl protease